MQIVRCIDTFEKGSDFEPFRNKLAYVLKYERAWLVYWIDPILQMYAEILAMSEEIAVENAWWSLDSFRPVTPIDIIKERLCL